MPMLRRMLLGLNTKMGGGAAAADPIADIEALLPAGSYFWLGDDAALGTVTTWTDRLQSLDLSATGTQKPTAAEDAAFNNKVALDFDGSNDRMFTGAFTAVPHPGEMFVVAQADEVPAQSMLVDGLGEPNRMVIWKTSSLWRLYSGATLSSATAPDTSVHVHRALFNTTTSEQWLDGVSIKTGNAGSQSLTGVTVGNENSGASPFNGRIAAVIFAPASLGGDGATIVSKLQTYYGL